MEIDKKQLHDDHDILANKILDCKDILRCLLDWKSVGSIHDINRVAKRYIVRLHVLEKERQKHIAEVLKYGKDEFYSKDTKERIDFFNR